MAKGKAFGMVPPEPPRSTDLALLAPQMGEAISRLFAKLEQEGYPPLLYEGYRSPERQAWLWGFGRVYDDGRGVVTRVQTPFDGWHFYGLAVDVIHRHMGFAAPGFYEAVGRFAPDCGLKGWRSWLPGSFLRGDRPHVQWGRCRATPKDAHDMYLAAGRTGVWSAVGAR